MTKQYIPRKAEAVVSRLMGLYKSVTVTGPRQCGKTTMLKRLFPGGTYLNIENPNILNALREDPTGLLSNSAKPVIIDEIQLMPELVNTLQYLMDESEEPGQYVLTGSFEAGIRAGVSQSLAGRTALVNMLPFSISELALAGIETETYEQILRGFFPGTYMLEGQDITEYYANYISLYVQKDVESILHIKNRRSFINMLHLLAGRAGSILNFSSISNDTGISSTTIREWVSLLEACHIVFLLPAWSRSISGQVVKAPKVFFSDTGLLCGLLGIETKAQLMRDPLRGSIFENMVVMEAYKALFNAYRRPSLFYFRDSKGLEVDLIHEKERNRADLYEIKSSENLNPEFAASMEKVRNKLSIEQVTKTVVYAGQTVRLKDRVFLNYGELESSLLESPE